MTKKASSYLKNVWLWVAIIAAAFSAWGLVFYSVAQSPSSKTVQIWVGSPQGLSSRQKSKVSACAEQNGMEKVEFGVYDPSDGFYAQAFAIKASSVDIFVLNRNEALEIAQTGLFAELEGFTGGLVYQEKTIGVLYGNDLCVLVNAKSRKDNAVLKQILSVLTEV